MILRRGKVLAESILRRSQLSSRFLDGGRSAQVRLVTHWSTPTATLRRTVLAARSSSRAASPNFWKKCKEQAGTLWVPSVALAALSTVFAYVTLTTNSSELNDRVAHSASGVTSAMMVNEEGGRNFTELLSLLHEAVGEDNVTVSAEECEAHGSAQYSCHQPARFPDVVVAPATTEEVVAIVKACAKYDVPMIPYGGATSLEGHIAAPAGGCSIDFGRMNKILQLNKADHDVVIQPGIGYMELNEMLGKHGLWFPLDPGPGASLGGMCACSCSGSTAVRYGTMKENVVSLTVVLANGEVVKTKSRASKSSAGYDLTHLFVGSEGTLGVITEMTVKAHKIPEYSTAVRIAFDSIDAAAETVQDTLAAGIQVGRAELMDDSMMVFLNKANKTNHVEATTLLFELSGESPGAVEHATSAVLALAEKRGGGTPYLATDPEVDSYKMVWRMIQVHERCMLTLGANLLKERKALWRERKEALWSMMGLYPDLFPMVTDVCVPVSRLAELITESKEQLDASPLPASIVAHAGDGNFHAFIMLDEHGPSEVTEAERLSSFMVHKAIEMEGTCTGEHGVGVGKIKYLPVEHGPGAMHTMRQIKRALDPRGLMNPGKILEHRHDPETGRHVLCG